MMAPKSHLTTTLETPSFSGRINKPPVGRQNIQEAEGRNLETQETKRRTFLHCSFMGDRKRHEIFP
jgi:hypothetical protein